MDRIRVPDIPGPTAQLCYKQAPNMTRCDRRLHHGGRHSWEHDPRPVPVAQEESRLDTITILVEKGYLPRRYPLTAHEFYPALLRALESAPPALTAPKEP